MSLRTMSYLSKSHVKALLRCITLGLARMATPSRSPSLWRGLAGSLVKLAVDTFDLTISLTTPCCVGCALDSSSNSK